MTGWPTLTGDATPTIGHNSGEVAEPPKYEIKHPAQPETEEAEAFRLRRNAEIDHWLKSKESFATAQQHERDYRTKVFRTLFPKPTKGTNRYPLGGGYAVKLTYTLTYTLGNKNKVDPDSGEKISIAKQIQQLEAEVAKLGEAHLAFFEGVVKWVPEVSGSAYEKLDADSPVQSKVRDMISEHLTIKPSETPTLAWEEPKEPK